MCKNMLRGFLSFLAVGMFVFCLSASQSYAATAKKWTFAVYLDADNNLEDAGIADFLEMAKVGSSADVNVVVQMDRAAGNDTTNGNWTSCKRFYVTKDMTPTAANQLSDLGESNMGSPATLTAFIKWTKENYPADKYALILWNHGGGWRARGAGNSPMMRACCWDDGNSDDCLYMKEVRTAIEDSGQKLDLIGFDACLMGHVEVAYELKGVLTDNGVVVGSEETEPGDGWPYTAILNKLNGSSSAETLGFNITDEYGKSYGAAAECTQACSRKSKIDDVVSKLNTFADAMNDNTKLSAIQKARTSMKAFAEADGYFGLDLYKFADLVGSSVSDVKSAADALKTAIDAAMVDVYAGTARQGSYSIKGKGGLCVYFPSSKSDYDSAYGTQINYGSETAGKWDDFLKRYYAGNLGTGTGTGGNTGTVAATATLSRKTVAASTLYASVTLTIKPSAGTVNTASVVIPNSWTPPQSGSTKGAGYVKAYIYKLLTTSYPLSVSLIGQKATISIPSAKQQFTGKEQIKLAYYKFTTQKTSGSAVFTTSVNGTAIAKSPAVTVGSSKLAIGDEDVDEEAVTEDGQVKRASLGQNYPNPFNPSTTFNYYLEDGGRVTIKLYNVAGQEVDTVIDEDQVAGEHAIQYDSGDKLSRGVYYYRMTLNGKEIGTKRAVVLK